MSEAAPGLTAELVADGAAAAAPVISPDGRRVAYAVATDGGTGQGGRPHSTLWLAAADGSSPPSQLTDGTARDRLPRWAPEGAALFFVSDRLEPGTGQLQRIRLDGGGAEALTAWRGGISDHCPLADGRMVAVLAEDEPTAEDERRQAERDDAMVWGENDTPTRLRLLDLVTGGLRTVDGLADRHVVEVAQRPDGGPLAVLSWACPDIDPGALHVRLHLVDPVTAAVQDLGPIGVESGSPAWWQLGDAWHLAHLAMTPPGLVGGLAVFDTAVPATGPAGEQRNLTAGMTVCPEELVQVADGPPLAVFADGLDTALHRLDPVTLRFRPVAAVGGLLRSLSVSRSGALVAAMRSTAHEPMNVHAGPAAGPLARLSDTRPELRRISWGTQERLHYTAPDGLKLDGLLILPAGMSRHDGPFPLVTLVQGGPYTRYADSFLLGYVDCGQWLATGGYAVFLPNQRGGSGHGHQFAAAVAGAVGTAEWTDIVSGIDLLVAEGVADPGRLGIGGWSHGGFMAAWAIGQTGRFKAAMTGAGPTDWGMLTATGENGAFEAALGGSSGWEGAGPHRHDQLSPVSYASKIATPVLILHGERDANTPLSQAVYFHRALRHYGVEHELVVYPREGHYLAERNHQVDALRRTRAWFDRWLGGPAPDDQPSAGADPA
jgi:dipeptidyl aminopeptidase/acylaminoacyl peptidase